VAALLLRGKGRSTGALAGTVEIDDKKEPNGPSSGTARFTRKRNRTTPGRCPTAAVETDG
jgi:hypothetical protein